MDETKALKAVVEPMYIAPKSMFKTAVHNVAFKGLW
jgi:hypothetical protein